MAGLHWLSSGGRHPYAVIHVNHGTAHGKEAEKFVRAYCKDYYPDLTVVNVKGKPPKGASEEAWWREKRLEAFKYVAEDMGKDYPVVTGHNLDDSVEQFVLNTLVRANFDEKFMAYHGPANVIRPFRTWNRRDIKEYTLLRNLPFIEDESNNNTKYQRNLVRKEIIPGLLDLNPGLYAYIRRQIIKHSEQEHESINLKQKLKLPC